MGQTFLNPPKPFHFLISYSTSFPSPFIQTKRPRISRLLVKHSYSSRYFPGLGKFPALSRMVTFLARFSAPEFIFPWRVIQLWDGGNLEFFCNREQKRKQTRKPELARAWWGSKVSAQEITYTRARIGPSFFARVIPVHSGIYTWMGVQIWTVLDTFPYVGMCLLASWFSCLDPRFLWKFALRE